MKRFFICLMVIASAALLTSCGSRGSAAPAAASVTVVPGDNSVTVTWDMQSGVEYWVYSATGTGITPQNCISMYLCRTIGVSGGATSPLIIPGLYNGATYSVTINGRSGGGKGGPGTPSVQFIPRLAGGLDADGKSTWTMGSPQGASSLLSVAYGLPTVNTGVGAFVAVGANGALFSSTDALSWTAMGNPVHAANFNAVIYAAGKFWAVGSGGVVLQSADAINWAQVTSSTVNDLYAITSNGVGLVATGANGTIITSNDGTSWTTVTSGTGNALYGVANAGSRFVAVGASGTLLSSTDGATWSSPAYLPSYDLKGLSYGNGIFVVVGDNGTLVTSPDGLTWTLQPQISTTQLNAVTYGHQFVAVDNVGSIYSSTDGVSWVLAQTSSSPLYAVLPAQYFGGTYNGQYIYTAVGANGANWISR